LNWLPGTSISLVSGHAACTGSIMKRQTGPYAPFTPFTRLRTPTFMSTLAGIQFAAAQLLIFKWQARVALFGEKPSLTAWLRNFRKLYVPLGSKNQNS